MGDAGRGASAGASAGASTAPAPPPTTGTSRSASPSRFARLRSGADRVPTKWFAGIATGIFLVVTAAFGGLATAAEPELPELEAGETFASEQVDMTAQRAFISDEQIDGLTNELEPNEDVIALVVDITNNTDSAQPGAVLNRNITLTEHPEVVPVVAHLADTTALPWYQPDVPTTVVFGWILPEGTYAEGEKIRFSLGEQTFISDPFFEHFAPYWSEPELAASVVIPTRILEPEPEPAS